MTKTEQLFDDAINLIHSRGSQYGHPMPQHSRIAQLWSAYLGYPITANQVAVAMALVKLTITTKTRLHILRLPRHAMKPCKTMT